MSLPQNSTNNSIDVIILAGGLGTRLRGAIPHLPKALAPIQGTPFLQILLKKLLRFSRISKMIIALGHKADEISSFLRPLPSIVLSIESVPLGTGGAILQALDKTNQETLLVVNGDTFFNIDLDSFYEFHKKKHSLATLAIRYEQNKKGFGSLKINSDLSIARFEEKSTSSNKGWVSGGVYLFEKKLFSGFKKNQNYSLEYDLLPLFIQKKAFAYCSAATFIDIGTPESYDQAQHLLQPWISQ